ncbi:MAG: tRNA-Thr(GGU) m(6)t(6)A37 methyltransferase TsaA [Roseibaca calidilacus]|uniref:tRNA-Thr(GGU) m(6)t(6)A37 methyltransferase TsaA n=1 Tax=Roseibaca calidilacus TaxID=1666912 RepID=A0A0P7WPR5_9RHOB|nr:tRNA (N6-threonylcarbamoyladenosine(37)-N6)-methyltransferase TrmO [Roseibaca calidilacus]KPP92832.1 MAG: tRNA-Thr(GGU) m(6)t(6)A37 methyltransferase TsaA [Roseibaca calidilacus]CUX80096.1 tRNA-Thr(GGU) m(6)t(6)A37 methyltransferase TsaA [Roseibaca calidilacus]
MTTTQTLRPGEVVSDTPLPVDATLAFIGHIETPWHHRADCPRQGDPVAGPDCTIVLNMPWDQALDGIEQFERLDILYWLHQSRRDLVLQNPKHAEAPRGTFSLRSPIRPNPIGLSNVQLVRRDGTRLIVRGLECVSGTPLIDIKPDRCQFTPVG